MRTVTFLRHTTPVGPPPPELMEAIMNLGAEADAAGALVDFAGLMAASPEAKRIVSGDGGLTITDGPFTESKEVVSYAVYETATVAEAVEWASRFADAHRTLWPGWQGEVDVFPVYQAPPGA